ncbi:ATP-binding protein [Streptomyces sp. TLI_171]|uniref:ATP-binding protein n=1 Tax=Streptomyces sp. TLI_171 TaxID=1938859 RepID=UPI000C192C32|nr:ATP-binding protein [Streptomyces sp. TLI_171]RKE05175.1 anti-sigma regulatory factor (Ser/Thr protein kinase) [Streptomyces sp. TLI_171]
MEEAEEPEAVVSAVGWARTLPLSSSIQAGRAWTRRHLDELGWTEHAAQSADAVIVTVSELLTNAHRHAHSNANLVLTWDGSCLYVSVHDHSTRLPHPREASTDATSGRGMALIDALADDWNAHTDGHGKTVTARFHPHPTP